jgi:polyisoprenoid-binding protein YceI
MRSQLVPVALLLALFAAPRVQAQARSFQIDGGQAQFVSEAPLERITGNSAKVRGALTLDPAQPGAARGEVRVAVASIRTGVELRDEHLRGASWLDSGRFPDAIFSIGSVTGGALVPNQASELNVSGTFEVHGVKRDLSTTARVRYTPGPAGGRDGLRIQASFVVQLEHYKVSIPSIVALKVAKNIRVNVDLRASAPAAVQAPVEVTSAPEPAKVEPAPALPEPSEPAPSATAQPARKPAAKPRPPTPSTPRSDEPVVKKPRDATAANASAANEQAPERSPAVNAAPSTPEEASEALRALLRKAHYELVHGDQTRALRFVQQAQKLLPKVERGLD